MKKYDKEMNKQEKIIKRLKKIDFKKKIIFKSYNITDKLMNAAPVIIALYTAVAGISFFGMIGEILFYSNNPFMWQIFMGSFFVSIPPIAALKIANIELGKKVEQYKIQEDYLEYKKETDKEFMQKKCDSHESVLEQYESIKKELLLIQDYCNNKSHWNEHINNISLYLNEKYNTEIKEEDKEVQKVKKYIKERTTK